jgi:xanthine/uracil permease
VHDLAFSLPGFAALTLATLTAGVAFARRRSGWFALYSALSGVAFAVLFVFATMGFADVDPWTSAAGLWQRLCVSVGWLWLAVLAANRRGATR